MLLKYTIWQDTCTACNLINYNFTVLITATEKDTAQAKDTATARDTATNPNTDSDQTNQCQTTKEAEVKVDVKLEAGHLKKRQTKTLRRLLQRPTTTTFKPNARFYSTEITK